MKNICGTNMSNYTFEKRIYGDGAMKTKRKIRWKNLQIDESIGGSSRNKKSIVMIWRKQ